MYIDPFGFGIFIGAIGTILLEVLILIGVASTRSKK